MKEPKDKRTTAYKEWKIKFDKKPKGLGDTVEKITEATGIKKVVKKLFGDDCGCDERKAKLNKIFNYKNINCPTEEDFNYLATYFKNYKQKVNIEQRKKLIFIYNNIFNKKQKDTSCTSCIRNIVDSLKRVYNTYI